MTVGDERAPQAKRRRRVNAQLDAEESIYVKREPAPYVQAIRPLRDNDADVARDDGGATAESSEMAAERSRRESYQARARKAWDTKRRRQRERFEQLEAPARHVSVDGPLSTPYRALPDDCPKDDLLRSLHAYASRYYASKGLLQPEAMSSQARRRQSVTPHVNGKDIAITRNDVESSSDDDYGSVYQDSNDDDGTAGARSASLSVQPLDEVLEGPRKAGGQRGKRKVKDMHRALDGPALLALGMLVQEQIVARINAEGFTARPVGANGNIQSDFELSDDEDEDHEEASDA